MSRFPRRVFLPVVYAFFIACLVLFQLAFLRDESWVAPVFFIWVAVFNLFAVSVFWSFMSDIFDHGQAKRLYGAIGAGGAVGNQDDQCAQAAIKAVFPNASTGRAS